MHPDEAALRGKRTPQELRFLKKHIEDLKAVPSVQAALEIHDSEAPQFTLEALQQGVLIDGEPCRLTIGTVALLRATRCRCLGFDLDDGGLNSFDIAHGVFLIADSARNIAVSVADDPDELAAAVKKFAKRLDPNVAALQLTEFLKRSSDALRTNAVPADFEATAESEQDTLFHAADDAWVDDLDLIAHEYHWADTYILWQLPIIRVAKLKESIMARRTGQPRKSTRDKTGIAYLKEIEKQGGILLSNGN